jgi:hypothetical protein
MDLHDAMVRRRTQVPLFRLCIGKSGELTRIPDIVLTDQIFDPCLHRRRQRFVGRAHIGELGVDAAGRHDMG